MRDKFHLRASNDSLLNKDKSIDDQTGKTLFLSDSNMQNETFLLTAFEQPTSEIVRNS